MLSKEQNYCLSKCKLGENMAILGPAGTGKTKLIQAIMEWIQCGGVETETIATTTTTIIEPPLPSSSSSSPPPEKKQKTMHDFLLSSPKPTTSLPPPLASMKSICSIKKHIQLCALTGCATVLLGQTMWRRIIILRARIGRKRIFWWWMRFR